LKHPIHNRGSIGVLIGLWVFFVLAPSPAADADETANVVSVVDSNLDLPSQRSFDRDPMDHLPMGLSPGTNHAAEPLNRSGDGDVSQQATASSSQIATVQLDKELSKAELLELEKALLAIGFPPGPVDGKIDDQSKQAIRQYQVFAVLWPDGEPQRRLLIELQGLVKFLAERKKSGGQELQIPNQEKQAITATDAENMLSSDFRGWRRQHLNNPDQLEVTVRPSQKIPQPRPEFQKSVASRGAPAVAATKTPLPKYVRDAINTRLASGHTPLTRASARSQPHALKALLDYGANPNLAAQDQATALMYAAWNGDTNSARRLLHAGADPNSRNADGKTALMASARIGHGDVVALLLRHGAVPDQQTVNGWTALMYAVWSNHAEAVQTLIEFRADLGIRNDRGQTAVDLASARKRTRIQALLVQPRSVPSEK